MSADLDRVADRFEKTAKLVSSGPSELGARRVDESEHSGVRTGAPSDGVGLAPGPEGDLVSAMSAGTSVAGLVIVRELGAVALAPSSPRVTRPSTAASPSSVCAAPRGHRPIVGG